jgi:hypothetical protein
MFRIVNTKFLGLHIDNHIDWKNIVRKLFLSYVEHVMPLGQWSLSVTLTLASQFTRHIFIP